MKDYRSYHRIYQEIRNSKKKDLSYIIHSEICVISVLKNIHPRNPSYYSIYRKVVLLGLVKEGPIVSRVPTFYQLDLFHSPTLELMDRIKRPEEETLGDPCIL